MLATLVLTMGGLYAVLTTAVSPRTRELAMRAALGARDASLRWMVLTEGLSLVAAGALVGFVVAVRLMRLLASQLYGVAPHDAAMLAAGLLGLVAAGALACDMPRFTNRTSPRLALLLRLPATDGDLHPRGRRQRRRRRPISARSPASAAIPA